MSGYIIDGLETIMRRRGQNIDQGDVLILEHAIKALKGRSVQPSRNDVLEEIEKLIGAVEGRHFAAIETASREEDKKRHGTKVAFAMELRAAIRALKRTDEVSSEVQPKGE